MRIQQHTHTHTCMCRVVHTRYQDAAFFCRVVAIAVAAAAVVAAVQQCTDIRETSWFLLSHHNFVNLAKYHIRNFDVSHLLELFIVRVISHFFFVSFRSVSRHSFITILCVVRCYLLHIRGYWRKQPGILLLFCFNLFYFVDKLIM